MRFLSTIATLSILLVPAITFDASVAQAGSGLQFVQAQKTAQFQKRNSSSRRGGSNSFGANIGGKGQVCCTDYNHEDGYSGCATFQDNSCPLYARFTPPPEDY